MRSVDSDELDPVIDAIYETSLAPQTWEAALRRIADVFHSGFADIFARSDDRSRFHGVAYGLDRADYEDEFLGVWFKRNVWGLSRPTQVAGEIVSTREMTSLKELRSSEIFVNYLDKRGLHEGLRLSIWTGGGWIQDMSLLRPFSSGPYEDDEIATARRLLPHLQRAAAVTRRLAEAEAVLQSGLLAIDMIDKAAFLLDGHGLVLRHNQHAELLLMRGDGLFLRGGALLAGTDRSSMQLGAALAHATGRVPDGRMAQSVRLPRVLGGGDLLLTAVPLALRHDWAMMNPPAALVFINEPPAPRHPAAAAPLTVEHLMALFQLTVTEAELGHDIAAGRSLSEIASRRGRSINTLRTQLRSLMSKTNVHRQADLVRLLISASSA
jgi:DNA-binding CsgD family transcriptional regulator